MKLRIISDGSRLGTRVLDESGNQVEGVTRIWWEADGKTGQIVARIEIDRCDIDVIGDEEGKSVAL
jgi:hypothetical protein